MWLCRPYRELPVSSFSMTWICFNAILILMCLLILLYPRQASEVDFPLQQYGISPERFQENTDLSSFFKILTTSTDEDDKVRNQTNFYILFIQEWKLIIFNSAEKFLFFSSIHIRYMSPQHKPTAILWLHSNGIQR